MPTTVAVSTSADVITGYLEGDPSTTASSWLTESYLLTSATSLRDSKEQPPTTEFPSHASVPNDQLSINETLITSPVFEVFIIIETVMCALELILVISVAVKLERWRRNYRNQMLMQLSLVRFIKQIVSLTVYFTESSANTDSVGLYRILESIEIYVDFVIGFLVYFFIRHMYDSLIVVLVKIRQDKLVKVSLCGWLLPVPLTVIVTVITVYDLLRKWTVYMIICCVFKWPQHLLGTVVYITILFKVFNEKNRRFVTNLTIITFLLCLNINLYIFSKDVIHLWCIKSFSTLIVRYTLGVCLDLLVLILYLTLIALFLTRHKKSRKKISVEIPMIER